MKLPSLEKKILESKQYLKMLAFEQEKYDKKINNNYYSTHVQQNPKRIDYMELKVAEIEQLPNQQALLTSILEFQKECVKAKVSNFYSYYFISNVKYLTRDKAQQFLRRQMQLVIKSKSAYHNITEIINGRERYLSLLKKQLEQYSDISLFKHIKALEGKTYDNQKENQLVQTIYSKIRGLRLINIQIIQEIRRWKKSLQDFRKEAPYSMQVKDEPVVFIYRDQNYLIKMINDNNFIFDSKFDGIKFASENDPFLIKPLKMQQNFEKTNLEVGEELRQKIVECLQILALQKGEDIKLKLQKSKVQDTSKNKKSLVNRRQTIGSAIDQSSIVEQRINKIKNAYKTDKLNLSRINQSSGKKLIPKDEQDQFDRLIRKYQEQNIKKLESKLKGTSMKRYSTQEMFRRGSLGDSTIVKKNVQLKKEYDQIDDLKKESDDFKRRAIQSMQFKYASKPIIKITSQLTKQDLQFEAKKEEEQRKQKIKNMFEKYRSMDATVKQQKTKVVALTKLKKQNNMIRQLKQKLQVKQQEQRQKNNRKSQVFEKQIIKNIIKEEEKPVSKLSNRKKQIDKQKQSPSISNKSLKNKNQGISKNKSQSFDRSSRVINQNEYQKIDEGLKNLKQKIREITGTKDKKQKIQNGKNEQFFITQLSKVQNNISQIQENSSNINNSKIIKNQQNIDLITKRKIKDAEIQKIYKKKQNLLLKNNVSTSQRKSFIHGDEIKQTETNKQLRKKIEKQLNEKYKKLKSENQNESISSINSTYIHKEDKQLQEIQTRKLQLQKQIKVQSQNNKNTQEEIRKQKIQNLTKIYKSLDKVSKDQKKKISELNNLKEQYKKMKTLKKQYHQKKSTTKLKKEDQVQKNVENSKKNEGVDDGLKNLKQRIKQITGSKTQKKYSDSQQNKRESFTISQSKGQKNEDSQRQNKEQDKKKIRDSQISRIYSKKQKLLVKDDIYNILKKGRKLVVNNEQIKQVENNQELRKKIEDELKQKYNRLNSQNYSRMSEQMTFNSGILQKQTKALMEAQRKRLQFQKIIIQQQMKQDREQALKKYEQEARQRQQKIRQAYEAEIRRLNQQFKKQNFDIKFKLQVQEMKRKQKQEELKLQLERKQKLQAEIIKMGLNNILLTDKQKQIQSQLQYKLLQNEDIKQEIQEYRQKIQRQAMQELRKIQMQNQMTLAQITKRNEEEAILKAAIQQSRKNLQKQFQVKNTGLQQLKELYDKIQSSKKSRVENYYKQLVQSDVNFTEQMKLKLKLELIEELELQQQREIMNQKMYEQEKQLKIDMMKYEYLKIVQKEGIALEQSEKEFIKLHEQRLVNAAKPLEQETKQVQENKQSILLSVQQRKKKLLKNVESDEDQKRKVDVYKPEVIKQVDQNEEKQATTIIQNNSPKKQLEAPQKETLEIINEDQKKISKAEQQTNILNIQSLPDKQKYKSIVESQQQILKKWNTLKPFLKPTSRIYISMNDIQQYLKNFIAKQDIEFANMIPYTEKQLQLIFRKKQVDIFQQAFGWKQSERYILIGKVSCLGQIQKLYGNIQVEIRLKMDGKNIHEKKYFAKKIKFFQSIGYMYQKKLNEQQNYAIKILIKIPKAISPIIKNTNKVNITFNIQMQYRNIEKSNNENSFIFPLAKKLSNYLTEAQKIQLDKYGDNDFISKELFKMIMHFDKGQQSKMKIEKYLPGIKIEQAKKQMKMALNFEFPICLSTYPCYRFSAEQFYNIGLTTYYKYVKNSYIFLVIPLETSKLQFNLDTYLKLIKKATEGKQTTVWMPIWKTKKRNIIDNYGIKPFIYKCETTPSFDIGSIVQQPKGNCNVIKPPFIFAVLSQHIQKYEQMTPIFAQIVKAQDLLQGKDLV